jgi:membrane protease YdiL (CAAX protease family)
MSSSSFKKNLSFFRRDKKQSPLYKNVAFALVLSVWVIVGFFASQISVSFLWQAIFSAANVGSVDNAPPLLQLVVTTIAYIASAVFIIGVPWALGIQLQKNVRQSLGIQQKPHVSDTWKALLGYGVYFFLTLSATLLMTVLWKGFDLDEAQQVGFGSLTLPIEYIMAFIALVILPPIAEELLFRGYLFGTLRKKISFIPSMILTSIIFAVVHLKFNVGVDVFCLSLVLCYLREKTGAIWAGVILHMLKNSIAFYLLFVRPDLLHLIR